MDTVLHTTAVFKGFFRSKRTRLCFYATAVFGLLSYLYLFVNNINNNDMIACMPYGYGTGISSGRWMLQILGAVTDRIWGVYSLPLFNGVLTLLLLALSSAVLVRVLDIQAPKLCFALAAITATVAPIASTMFFLFTSHFYALSILLLALAAYLFQQRKLLHFLGAAFLTACATGIYQAYLPFFAGLLLLLLLGSCLKKDAQPNRVFLDALRALGLLVGSYLLYSLLLKLSLLVLHTQLSDYQGISQMGSLSLSSIPQTYVDFLLLPLRNCFGFNATVLIRGVILLLFLFCALVLVLFWRSGWKNTLLGCLFLALLPLSANAFSILAPESTIYTRMCLGLIVVFYLPVLLAEKLTFQKSKQRRFACLLVAALLLLASTNYAWQSNGNYQFVYYSNRKAENYFTTMFTRIKSTEGYHEGLQVVFVGNKISDESYVDNWLNTPFVYNGRIGAVGQINQYSRAQFIANYLGYACRPATPEELTRYASQLSELPSYPNDGSILIVDNFVFVLLE